MSFSLHEQLAADTFYLGDLPLCRVLLMTDARFPWLVLVPRIEAVREIHELAETDRFRLVEEITLSARQLQRHAMADKMNIAALGNQVPQLHIHVIARFHADSAWPNPVWGRGPAEPYPAGRADAQIRQIRDLLGIPAQDA